MKLRNPLLLQAAGFLGATVIGRLIDSLDIRVDVGPKGCMPSHPRNGRFIYVFWHDSLLMPTCFRVPTHILISRHSDGELIAQLVRHFRYGVVRGSSTRGGTAAVLNLIRVSEKTHLCVTPDGPKGPRRRVQPGTVFLASQTGLPIIPIGVGYGNAWRANSWDQFAVPKPFSQARVVFGEPIAVPPDLTIKEMAHHVTVLQESMTNATAKAERWVSGLPSQMPTAAPWPLAKSA